MLKCRSEDDPEVEPNVGLPDGDVSAEDEDDDELEFRYAVDSVPVLPCRPDNVGNAADSAFVGIKVDPQSFSQSSSMSVASSEERGRRADELALVIFYSRYGSISEEG